MPAIYCLCGDAVSQKAYDEANFLKSDAYRCDVCLSIWKEAKGYKKRNTGNYKGNPTPSKITIQVTESCAFEGLSASESAEKIGVAITTFRNAIYGKLRPEIVAAWQRGKQRRTN